MFTRVLEAILLERLAENPVVALLGARQTGKTTLAKNITGKIHKPCIYLDLESDEDRNKLRHAETYLSERQDALVILDEVQRYPDLFPLLRSLVDRHRISGRFMLLGSASPDLLMRSSESLAGRISFLYMHPLNYAELRDEIPQSQHWLRGGFPDMLLARSDASAFRKLDDFVNTYSDRELPLLGMGADMQTRRNLLRLLSSINASQLNISELSRALGYSVTTVKQYIGYIESAFLTFRLQPWFVNTGKRLTKNPRLHFTDTGLLHGLAGIRSAEDLSGHILIGASFESYVIQQVRSCIAEGIELYYYRTSNGAEMDLVLARGAKPLLAIEIKVGSAPKITKGSRVARQDLGNIPMLLVCNTRENYRMEHDIYCVNMTGMYQELESRGLLGFSTRSLNSGS